MCQRYAEKAIRRNSSTPTRDGELSIFSDLIPSSLLTYLYRRPAAQPPTSDNGQSVKFSSGPSREAGESFFGVLMRSGDTFCVAVPAPCAEGRSDTHSLSCPYTNGLWRSDAA